MAAYTRTIFACPFMYQGFYLISFVWEKCKILNPARDIPRVIHYSMSLVAGIHTSLVPSIRKKA
ncbi:hypothetical protein B0F90DRAFT_1762683 [Multifurca ochricompacta]|uniref:Uncharacterized protein n=1 Tax=Multifurca ochricompacta TaxID=376703 RepID=A0AAD4LZ34_9AGAM|nr:hypothetical protein B0F90DRAFT_1762683 [Multifurca ochricompacta]